MQSRSWDARCRLEKVDLGGRWVLTPHPGEFSRLTGADQDAVLDDPVGNALAASERLNAIVVLKGHSTISRRARRPVLDPRRRKPGARHGRLRGRPGRAHRCGYRWGNCPPRSGPVRSLAPRQRGRRRGTSAWLVPCRGPRPAGFPRSLGMKPPVLRVKKGAIVYDDTAASGGQRAAAAATAGQRARCVSRRDSGGAAGFTYFPLLIVAVGIVHPVSHRAQHSGDAGHAVRVAGHPACHALQRTRSSSA